MEKRDKIVKNLEISIFVLESAQNSLSGENHEKAIKILKSHIRNIDAVIDRYGIEYFNANY